MLKRALIRENGEVVSVFPADTGRIQLPGIGSLSPPVLGWRNHGFAVVGVVQSIAGSRPKNPFYYFDGQDVIETEDVKDVPDLPMAVLAVPDPEPKFEMEPAEPAWEPPAFIMRAVPTEPVNPEQPSARVRMPEPMADGLREPAQYEPGDMSDEERRQAARDLIRKTVADAVRYDNQVEWELALQAHNGNINALESFKRKAAVKGMTVEDLVDAIIAERMLFDRRVMRIHVIEAEALAEIDTTQGSAIDQIPVGALARINSLGA